MSKPKSNSILDALPENQRAQLEAWLFEENISYKDAQARLLADFNVRCSASSVSGFYQRTAQDRMLLKIKTSRGTANAVLDKFKENPADMYQVLLQLVGQIAFDAAFQAEKALDAETIYNFTKLVMTARKQDMEADALKLQRDKFETEAASKMLDQALRARADEINASGLSNQEKIAEMRRQAFKSVDDLEASGSVIIPKR